MQVYQKFIEKAIRRKPTPDPSGAFQNSSDVKYAAFSLSVNQMTLQGLWVPRAGDQACP